MPIEDTALPKEPELLGEPQMPAKNDRGFPLGLEKQNVGQAFQPALLRNSRLESLLHKRGQQLVQFLHSAGVGADPKREPFQWLEKHFAHERRFWTFCGVLLPFPDR